MSDEGHSSGSTVGALAILAELVAELSREDTVEGIARTLVSKAKWVIATDHCSLVVAAGDGFRSLPGGAVTAIEGPVRLAVDRRMTVRLSDPDGGLGACVGATDIGALMILPLLDGDTPIGTLNLGTRRADGFASIDAGLCHMLALNVGAAVRGARLLEREKEARRAAEHATRARDALLASVTHDLRNPLAAVAMLVSCISADLVGATPDLAQDLADIDRSVRRMAGMIDELLDGARIGAGQAVPLQLASTDLRELVHEALASNRGLLKGHRVVLDIAAEPLVCPVDGARFSRVLGNLLDNAFKYSPVGGVVHVTARRDGAGSLSVRVEDSGIGIPASDLPLLFQRFHRAANVGAIGGTGLGLATSKDIVEAHGGTLTVESEAGSGSAFVVRLPLSTSAPVSRRAPRHFVPASIAASGRDVAPWC